MPVRKPDPSLLSRLFGAPWRKRAGRCAGWILIGLFAIVPPIKAAELPLLATARQVRALDKGEAAKGYPVRLEGVLTYFNPKEGLCFVQDATAGVFLANISQDSPFLAGQHVEVEGTTAPGRLQVVITQPTLRLIEEMADPPPAIPLNFADFLSGQENAQRVEVRGVIQRVWMRPPHLMLLFRDGDRAIEAGIQNFPRAATSLKGLVDSQARVEGVCLARARPSGGVDRTWLLVPFWSDVVIEKAAPAPYTQPVVEVSALPERDSAKANNHRLHVQGHIARVHSDRSFALRDATGELLVTADTLGPLKEGDAVRAVGFLSRTNGTEFLADAEFELLGNALSALDQAPSEHAAPPQSRILTQARAIRELSLEELEQGLPVRLRGTVTFFDAEESLLFLQDSTSGIQAEVSESTPALSGGDYVEIEGFTSVGALAPMLIRTQVEKLGKRMFPEPIQASLDSLSQGRHEGQWVETYGVIRSGKRDKHRVLLELSQGGFKSKVWILGSDRNRTLAKFVDSAVRLRGVSAAEFDAEGRLAGYGLLVPGAAQVQMERPPVQDPYSLPVRKIGQLARLSGQSANDHRVRIRGHVTFQRLGELLFVTGQTGSVAVFTTQSEPVQTGDEVEVVGFPVLGPVAMELHDAIYRRTGNHAAVGPELNRASEVFNVDYHGALVQVEGRLLDQTVRPDEQVLVLQSEEVIFPARLANHEAADAMKAIREGSVLQVTGVCVIEVDPRKNLQSLQILMRSAEDLRIVQSASWWTAQRTLGAVGLTTLGMGLALVWVVQLRRRVDAQTQLIRERLEREAALQERYRELFENANDIVYTHDLNGTFTSINRAGTRILGYSEAEFLAVNGFALIAPEYREKSREMLRQKIERGGETTYEAEYLAKDGRRVRMEVSSRVIYEQGQPVAVHGIARDLTERMKAESALRESELRFRQMAENIREVFWMSRPEMGEVIYLSPAYERIWKRPARQLRENPASFLESVAAEDREKVRRYLREQARSACEVEYRITQPDETERWIRDRSVPIRDPSGQVVLVTGIAEDITEKKQIEKRVATFSKLGHCLSSTRSHEEAAQIIVDIADQLLGWDACYLHLISPDYETLIPLVHWDTVDGVRLKLNEDYAGRQPSPMDRRIAKDGKFLLQRHPSDPDLSDLVPFGDRQRLSASLMFVPIRSGSEVIGVFSIQSYAANAYTEADLETLQALADHCGSALDRIHAEQLLRESEIRLRTIVEAEPECVKLLDREGMVLDVNPAGLRLFEAESKRQLRGQAVYPLIDAADRPRFQELVENVFKDSPQSLELEIVSCQGTRRWVHTQAVPIRDDRGAITSCLCVTRDMTERKRAEEALRASEANYRNVVEGSIQGILIQQNFIIQFANPALARIFGYDHPREMIGRNIWDTLVAPEELPSLQQREAAAAQGQSLPIHHGWQGRRKDGSRIWIQSGLSRIEWKKRPAILSFMVDVTEKKRAEAALVQSEERFSRAFRATPVPVTITDMATGEFLDANDAFLRTYGFVRQEVIGHTAVELGLWIKPEERQRLLQMIESQKSIQNMEWRFRTKTGEIKETLISVERVEIGKRTCLLFISLDLTDRLRLENQLRHAQKMEAIGQMAAGIAHDFNNIMTVIQGHTGLMVSDDSCEPRMRHQLQKVLAASERASYLTKQLLAFSRKQLMQPRILDLNRVVAGAVKMLQRVLGERIVLETQCGADLPGIHADPGMIEQALVNLAANARDAMPQGGRLVISTALAGIDEAHVERNPEARRGDFVCLAVTDTGCGMEAEVLAKIFDPFFTTKGVGKGSGLGLSTVYGIMKQHQGWVEVSSQVGQGTTFRLYFLREEKPAEVPAPPAETVPDRPGSETILVVEDEGPVRHLIVHLLERQGYRVLEASTGQEALQVWREQGASVDLLLTDIMMPQGISGIDLAELLQGERPGLKVVYTSGYDFEESSQRVQLEEGVNFLPKPYHPPKLARMIRDCLDRGPASGSNEIGRSP